MKNEMIVKTGDFLIRDRAMYEVLIADDNIFVIGQHYYDEDEGCFITSYEHPEVYANQSSMNTLEMLHFEKVDSGADK